MTIGISVVIPAYNTERFVARAIESALAQSLLPREVIVIDDGSTDGTGDIAASFGTAVTLIRQRNAGVSAARNRGLRTAQGDFLAFLDSDDFWLPNKLETQLAAFGRHPELALVSTGWHWLEADGDNWPASDSEGDSLQVLPGWDSLLLNPHLGTPTVMVRTELALATGGFNESLPTAEDVDFFLRACRGRPYGFIAEKLAVFQLRPGSLTKTERALDFSLQMLEKLEQDFPDDCKLHELALRDCRLGIYRDAVLTSLYRGDGAKARLRLRDSLQYGRLPDHRLLWAKSHVSRLLHLGRTAFGPRR